MLWSPSQDRRRGRSPAPYHPCWAALCALLGLGTTACTARQPPALLAELPRPFIFAHRGGAGEAPEATLPAVLALAARDPEVGIEIDVRHSRDGRIVVIHDRSVDRTTNGTGRVSSLTLAELQALDAGYCATPGRGGGTAPRGTCRTADPERFPFRGKGYRIPTLEEVLTKVPSSTVIGIEVKEPGYEDQLAAIIRNAGRVRSVVVGSAHGDVAARLQSLLPEAAHYFPHLAATRLALAFHIFAVPRSGAGMRLDTKGIIDTVHRRGALAVGCRSVPDGAGPRWQWPETWPARPERVGAAAAASV